MTGVPSRLRALALLGLAASLLLSPTPEGAHAFPYVARRGDSLASVAERFYGKVELEKVLVTANGLDDRVPLLPGMRIEVPAVSHHRIAPGDTWESLAEAYLGDARRAEALALSNDTMPWLPPVAGREIVVPYVLRYVVRPGDSTPSIAYRFLGRRDDAYVVDRFNALKGDPVKPGDVVLVPVVDLDLTDEGRETARRGEALQLAEGAGRDRDAQDRAERELPLLQAEVLRGEWVAAIARGSALLGAGELTEPQLAGVHRALLEAFVALGEDGLAAEACAEWRRAAPDVALDPLEISPKTLRACSAVAGAPRSGALPENDELPSTSPPARSARPGRASGEPAP